MYTMKESALEVSAIENGTVIDHIPAHNLFNVMTVLNVGRLNNRMTFGTNLPSKRIGTKAIIKIADIEISEKEYQKIVVFAPNAHVSYIRDFKVAQKYILKTPDNIVDVVKCANPVCVTNLENLNTKFKVVNKEDMTLKCIYCEKITLKEQLKPKRE